MKPLWTAEKNSSYQSRASKIYGATQGFIIRYNPPDRVEDGKTFMSVNFPAMAMTAWVSDADKIAAQIARDLNCHGELLELTKLLKQVLEYEIRKARRDGDEEGANLKLFNLDRCERAIAAAEAEPEAMS